MAALDDRPIDGPPDRWRAGVWVLILMIGLAVAWAVLRLPLRDHLDRFLGADDTCRALCPGWREVAQRLSMAWLIGWAGIAGVLGVARLRLRPTERWLGVIVVTYGLVSVPAALVGGAGDVVGVHALRPPLGPMLASIPSVVIAAWAWTRPDRPSVTWPGRPRWSPITWWLAGMAGVALLASVAVAIAQPPKGFDELNFHGPLAVLLWRDGSLVDLLTTNPGRVWLSHPGTAELWMGALRVLGGEPLLVLGQLPFAVLGAIAVAAVARRIGTSARIAAVAGATWLLIPIVIVQSGRMSNDIVAASVGLAVCAWLVAPGREWTTGRLTLVLVGLALVAATKLALVPAVAGLGGVAIVWSIRVVQERPEARRPIALAWIVGLGLALLVVGPWFVRGLVLYGNPIHPAAFGPLAGVAQTDLAPMDGRFLPSAVWWPLYPLLSPDSNAAGLGLVWVAGVLPGLILAARAAPGRRPLWLMAVLTVVMLPSWWLLTRHEPRHLLLLTGLFASVVPFTLMALAGRWRELAAWILAVAGSLSLVGTLTTAIASGSPAPGERSVMYAPPSRTEVELLALPERHGVLLDDQCDLPQLDLPYPILGPRQARRIATLPCGASTDEALAVARRQRLDHVYAVVRADDAPTLDARYPADRFELLHRADDRVLGIPLERRLYRIRTADDTPGG